MSVWDWFKTQFASTAEGGQKVDLEQVQRTIGYHFRDTDLLCLALTHRSYAHAIDQYQHSNERLEFLGDSVLGLVIAEQLYADNPELREGELTKKKALLVSEATLAEIGIATSLNQHLLLAPEEDRSGGRDRPSIVSDAMESIIGAVFLDGGFESARDVTIRLIYIREPEIAADANRQNFKGDLLEYVQSRGDAMPQYEVISEEGPDHEKVFSVEVSLAGKRIGVGSGHSKKEAEQRAAASALKHLQTDHS